MYLIDSFQQLADTAGGALGETDVQYFEKGWKEFQDVASRVPNTNSLSVAFRKYVIRLVTPHANTQRISPTGNDYKEIYSIMYKIGMTGQSLRRIVAIGGNTILDELNVKNALVTKKLNMRDPFVQHRIHKIGDETAKILRQRWNYAYPPWNRNDYVSKVGKSSLSRGVEDGENLNAFIAWNIVSHSDNALHPVRLGSADLQVSKKDLGTELQVYRMGLTQDDDKRQERLDAAVSQALAVMKEASKEGIGGKNVDYAITINFN